MRIKGKTRTYITASKQTSEMLTAPACTHSLCKPPLTDYHLYYAREASSWPAALLPEKAQPAPLSKVSRLSFHPHEHRVSEIVQ